MNIKSLQVRNFQRITSINLTPAAPVLLVAGPNEAGKSSLRDAVRLALTGESTRVRLKKDYKAMLRDGAKDGEIAIALSNGGTAAVNLKSWERSAEGLGEITELLPLLLEPRTFASLNPGERRTVLFNLTGARFSGKAVGEMMVARGAPADKVAEVLPLLHGGFPAAHATAKEKVSEARGAWKATTGETWGIQKAEGWALPVPSLDQGALNALESNFAEAKAKLEDATALLNKLLGQKEAAASAPDLSNLDALIAQEEKVTAAIASLEEELRRVESTRPQTAATLGHPLTCPHCDGEVMLLQGRLVPHASQPAAADPKAIAAYQDRHTSLREDLRIATAKLSEIHQAKSRRQAVAGIVGQAPTDETIAAQRSIVDGLSDDLAALAQQLSDARKAARAHIEAEAKNEAAAEHHQDAKDWTLIVELLAPAGIPAELLEKAMAPFNQALISVSTDTGWPLVTIDSDMEILIGGRPYGLGSESAQWRADAAIAFAIASVSGIGFLCLDRVDVLDLANRDKCLRWLHHTTQTETITGALVLGTFKSPPQVPSSTFDVVWLEDGAMITQQENAA